LWHTATRHDTRDTTRHDQRHDTTRDTRKWPYIELVGLDEVGEHARAGDVTPLTDVDEVEVGREGEQLEARQAEVGRQLGNLARAHVLQGRGGGADRVGRGTTTPSRHVDQALIGELPVSEKN
jgi:hypothetical protein